MFAGRTLPGVSESKKRGKKATASFAKKERERERAKRKERWGKVSIRMLSYPWLYGQQPHHTGIRSIASGVDIVTM